jgi:HlyD family secretion protein
MMESQNRLSTGGVEATLGVGTAGRQHRRLRNGLVLLGILSVAGAVVFLVIRSRTTVAQVDYRTEVVERGTLTIKVTATGTLQPLRQVNVGTEISGIIESVSVDDNDVVQVGQVLARVNTDKLNARAEQARAALRVAEAALQQTRATLLETRNTLVRLEQVRELSGGRVPSQLEVEAAQAALARAEADEASKAASIVQAQATLAAIESDLAKATIRSPMPGSCWTGRSIPGRRSQRRSRHRRSSRSRRTWCR